MRGFASFILGALIVGAGMPLGSRSDAPSVLNFAYSIYCTKGVVNGTAVSSPVLLQNGDSITRDGESEIEFSGDEFETITVSGSGANVSAVVVKEGTVSAVCLQLESGTLSYVGDPLRRSVSTGGRRYIVRRRGFAVGAIGTKYTLASAGTSCANLTVDKGAVSVVSPWPFTPPITYTSSSGVIYLDPSDPSSGVWLWVEHDLGRSFFGFGYCLGLASGRSGDERVFGEDRWGDERFAPTGLTIPSTVTIPGLRPSL